MFARYYSKNQVLHTYNTWLEMADEIPVFYKESFYKERRLMLSQHNDEYPLKQAYDLFEKIFELPNVVFHANAYDGHMPNYVIGGSTFDVYKMELINRGFCFISNVIVGGDMISGIYAYYITEPGKYNRNADVYDSVIQKIQRVYFIDNLLKDL